MLPQDNYRALIPHPQALRPLVNQTVNFMYNSPGDEALRVFKNSFLRRIYWVEIYSTRNLTNSPEKRFVSATSSLTLTTGREANVEFGLSASFKGLGVSFGAGYRTFQVQETTGSRTEDHEYIIPPQESLYVYQRHYEFEDEFWWTLDAWNQIWTVFQEGRDIFLTSNTYVTIAAEEFMSRTSPPIEESLIIDVGVLTNEVRPHTFPSRRFENTTSRARTNITRLRGQLFVSISQISYSLSY